VLRSVESLAAPHAGAEFADLHQAAARPAA